MRLVWYVFRWTVAGAVLGAAGGYLFYRLFADTSMHYETTGLLVGIPTGLLFLLIGFFVGVFRDNSSGM
jgi:hypothetical protein